MEPRSFLDASSGQGIKTFWAVSTAQHTSAVVGSCRMASNAVATCLLSVSNAAHSAEVNNGSRSFVVMVVCFVSFTSLNLMFSRGHSVTTKSRGKSFSCPVIRQE